MIAYRNKYGELVKVRTDTVELPARGGEYHYNQPAKKPKIQVVIKRSDNFFEYMEEFERIREEAIKMEEQEKLSKQHHKGGLSSQTSSTQPVSA